MATATQIRVIAEQQNQLAGGLQDNVEVCLENLCAAAELCEKILDSAGVAELQRTHEKILETSALMQARGKAMELLPRQYEPSDTGTDFAALSNKLAEDGLEACRADESLKQARQDLAEQIWEVHQNGPKPGAKASNAEEDEDEDIVIESQQLAPNVSCPLTLTALLDLECPVEDEKGYVYEKAAIVDYLRREQRAGRGAVACPVAGTSHRVAEAKLKPAKKIVRAQRRHKLLPGRRTQAVDSVDVEDL